MAQHKSSCATRLKPAQGGAKSIEQRLLIGMIFMRLKFFLVSGIAIFFVAFIGFRLLSRAGSMSRLGVLQSAAPGTPLPDAIGALRAKGFKCSDTEVSLAASIRHAVSCYRYDGGARAPNGAGSYALLTANDGKIVHASVGPCGFLVGRTCDQVSIGKQ